MCCKERQTINPLALHTHTHTQQCVCVCVCVCVWESVCVRVHVIGGCRTLTCHWVIFMGMSVKTHQTQKGSFMVFIWPLSGSYLVWRQPLTHPIQCEWTLKAIVQAKKSNSDNIYHFHVVPNTYTEKKKKDVETISLRLLENYKKIITMKWQ